MKRTMAGTSVAVVLFGAPGLLAAGSARADEVSSTRSQITAIESQVAKDASAIHALTVAYDQANLDEDSLRLQVQADQQELLQLQQQVATTETALRREAILSYTGGIDPTAVVRPGTDPSVRAAYLSVATGSVSDSVDRYKTEQYQLNTATLGLERQEQASQAAALEVSASRAAALAEASAEQSQLAGLQSRLSHLLAARTGGPVNNGLVTVVHALVSPGGAGGVWLQLRECESGNNYQANTGNGFYGAYQFSQQTWSDQGYPGRPDLEPPAMQDAAAQKLQSEHGWGQWPACSAALGLH